MGETPKELNKVVEKKGPVAYRSSFPKSSRRMHDVFHVSVLIHYVSDPTHVIDMSPCRCQMRVPSRWSQSAFWTISFDNYNVEYSVSSRSNWTIIVHTRLPRSTHMICISNFLTCLID